MCGNAAGPSVYLFQLAGVKPASDVKAQSLHFAGDGGGRPNRVSRRVEPGKETVASSVYFVAAEALQLAANGGPERSNELPPAPIAHLGRHARRVDDVEEKNGRHATLALALCHGASMRAARALGQPDWLWRRCDKVPPCTGDVGGDPTVVPFAVMTATVAAMPNRIRSFYAERFKREWLGKDIVAGLVLASLLVPQGMAYAQLAGLPPITGLYTSITCLVAYALVGPSRVLVLGPDSALGGMIAATVLPLVAASGDPNKAVIYASAMSLMVGALMIIGARAGLGFIADLLSNPIQVGYINGLALVIFVGQLPKLFGFSTDASGFINETIAFVQGVLNGLTVPAALGIGLFSVALMLVLARFIPRIPGVLIAVIAAMVIANIGLGLFSERVVNLADKWSNALTVASQVANLR